jgi:hypothetical protein
MEKEFSKSDAELQNKVEVSPAGETTSNENKILLAHVYARLVPSSRFLISI